MPYKGLLLAEVLQAELTDIQLIQMIELLWVWRVVPSEYLVFAQVNRLHNKKSREDVGCTVFYTELSLWKKIRVVAVF